jgi:serine phosphatase RsbU (regulator of sigma subunit)
MPGYDISGWTQAAAATGGDFYDYFDLPGGQLGIVVADVSGHGLAASLLACETRALIRAAATTNDSLAGIVTRVNDLLFRDLHNERFVVLFLGALEPDSGRLAYVGAGCGPFHYRHAHAACGMADSTMAPLGIFPTVPAGAVREVTLEAGDVMMVSTDGFYEWENAGREQFGRERLAEIVNRYPGLAAGDLIACLHHAVAGFAGGVKQADDLTAMVIRRTPVVHDSKSVP